jgi:hypothetical protein
MSRTGFSVVVALLLLLLQFSRISSTILPRDFIAARDDAAHTDSGFLAGGDRAGDEIVFLGHDYEDGPKTASFLELFPGAYF